MKILRFTLLAILTLWFGNLTAEEEFRTWQIVGGGHFEAKLNAVGATTATLENREGKTIDFPLADLQPSDRSFIRDWQMAQTNSPANGSAANSVDRSEFAERVYKDLIVSKDKRLVAHEATATENPKYFAFYRSAMWCPPCRAFTPKLADFYRKHKRRNAPFELVFISSDRSEEQMAEYMHEYRMDWPAFRYKANRDIVRRNGNGIPSLIITDAEGNKLLDSYTESGDYIGPTQVMQEFEKLLAAAAKGS